MSLKLLPEGYILWYHSHVNPQVAALAEPSNRDNLLLPHPKAFVSAVMPEGVIIDIDRNTVGANGTSSSFYLAHEQCSISKRKKQLQVA